MNGAFNRIFVAAGVGSLALVVTTATSLAGEPIIMGTQRAAPDPGQRPRLDERLEQGTSLTRSANPIRDESGMSLRFVPAPMTAPSKRSQAARDEKANWMMLNQGDLTDSARSDTFGSDARLQDSMPGRRDYFFEKTDGRSLNGRQPLPDKVLDLVNRPGQAMKNSGDALTRQDNDEPSRRGEALRDSTGASPDGRKSLEEPGLGPLMNPGRISGAESIERWSTSINKAVQRGKINGVNEAQIRREQYLDYVGGAQYSGANYPANSAWDKYQREWDGASAAGRGASRPGLSGPMGGISSAPISSRPAAMAPGGLTPGSINGLGSRAGSLSGSSAQPLTPQQRRAPSQERKVDFSAPGDPGSSFNFR